MKRFAQLFTALDETTKTNAKVDAMVAYFAAADPRDAAWAVHFLRGERPKRLIGARALAAWAMTLADIPDWLFEESYHAVGDLAETISLLLPPASAPGDLPLHHWIEARLLPLRNVSEEEQRVGVLDAWRTLDHTERFVWNKLITGSFRVGVSHALVVRALARTSNIPEAAIAHRLTGTWTPSSGAFQQLITPSASDADPSRPYPFYLAYPLDTDLDTLGEPDAWQAEWKWDGIRAQLIRRGGETFLWSRGDESVTERFPEITSAGARLPDGTVLDGEILPWLGDVPLSFAKLQRRIGRKTLNAKILAEIPVVFVAYDLLEYAGEDWREHSLRERRAQLSEVVSTLTQLGNDRVRLSPTIALATWDDARAAHARSREMLAEGLMLKAADSPYGVGRRRGAWWKWKVAPYAVDAVMIYAQPGHGRRASLHTDYTFAVWDDGTLVPFAKAYSGLTDAEIRRVDAWIRHNTVERFGPVRSVKPEQVFELGFEGIQASTRHKSGVAVRFPRILRWRTDKRPEDADTLATLRALMDGAVMDDPAVNG